MALLAAVPTILSAQTPGLRGGPFGTPITVLFPKGKLINQIDQGGTKTDVLMTYKSQRPYVFLLRNAFVRKNELFFVYPE